MYTGFAQATRAGISICVDDMLVPEAKHKLIAAAEAEVKEIEAAVHLGSGDPGRTLQQGRGHLGPRR